MHTFVHQFLLHAFRFSSRRSKWTVNVKVNIAQLLIITKFVLCLLILLFCAFRFLILFKLLFELAIRLTLGYVESALKEFSLLTTRHVLDRFLQLNLLDINVLEKLTFLRIHIVLQYLLLNINVVWAFEMSKFHVFEFAILVQLLYVIIGVRFGQLIRAIQVKLFHFLFVVVFVFLGLFLTLILSVLVKNEQIHVLSLEELNLPQHV